VSFMCGLSTRNIEDAFTDESGRRLLSTLGPPPARCPRKDFGSRHRLTIIGPRALDINPATSQSRGPSVCPDRSSGAVVEDVALAHVCSLPVCHLLTFSTFKTF
jgi:hypothetical protein